MGGPMLPAQQRWRLQPTINAHCSGIAVVVQIQARFHTGKQEPSGKSALAPTRSHLCTADVKPKGLFGYPLGRNAPYVSIDLSGTRMMWRGCANLANCLAWEMPDLCALSQHRK